MEQCAGKPAWLESRTPRQPGREFTAINIFDAIIEQIQIGRGEGAQHGQRFSERG